MITADRVILASWALFLLVWLGLSFFVKRDVRGGRSARAYHARILILAILAALGTALTGTFLGAILFLFAVVLFLSRVGREEHIMLELFPGAYPSYQVRTKRLIPFLW